MKAQVIVNKAGNEMVAMVVAFLHPKFQRVVSGCYGSGQSFGFELLFKEAVLIPLVDQGRGPVGYCF